MCLICRMSDKFKTVNEVEFGFTLLHVIHLSIEYYAGKIEMFKWIKLKIFLIDFVYTMICGY